MNNEHLIKAVIRHIFWTQTDDYDTTDFETAENREIASRIINIAKQQLPSEKRLRRGAIYQRCVQNLRIPNALYFYKHWC